ncbi:MAG: 1,4-alpha-glucan branching protein GlgB [Colwellia sp.]|nr:1,4-alpha-glucan branching protein GlgB [Colwellia sp.]
MNVKASTIKSVLNNTFIKQTDIDAIVNARHGAAHTVLGLQVLANSCLSSKGYLVISAFIPDVIQVTILDKKTQKQLATLTRVDKAGFFVAKLRRKKLFAYQLKVTSNTQTQIIEDAFAFSFLSGKAGLGNALLSELDIHLLNEGNHQKPYQKLGAHQHTVVDASDQRVTGVAFSLWAPNASSVAVIGDFNHWDGRIHPMENRSGYWTIFMPNVEVGSLYKFELKDCHGKSLPNKADPYASQAQYRPDTACIVANEQEYDWQDAQWLAQRGQRNARTAAISIYEVHLGSWRRAPNGDYLNYRDIAAKLIPYVLEMGFTHIQLMPISEFPFDGSWGYQPVGLFAPTARFGSRADFQFFVDSCHQANLGLLIDWVPGHFPSDAHGLAQFDGTHLYEHEDRRLGFHPDWNTLIYNYGRVEVANFLRASALHWLDDFHVDGIRVDAVASMLYLDYSRKEGEWLPNIHGGNENLEAVAFLQRFNEELYSQYPGTFSVAEESTSWPGVSRPTDSGGLGFGYKWNMGWMNDSLSYMQEDPIHRKHHHDKLSFSLVYAFDENFVLPLSHDEVVHGKGSILARMPGDTWQQFANLRAYYGFMWTHPGKKLLFMGCEFGQGKEWDHDTELDWQQLDIHWHKGVQRLVKDLNEIYTTTPALYEKDCMSEGFSWLEHDNTEQSIYSFIRYGNDRHSKKSNPVIVLCNFTPQSHQHYRVGVPVTGFYHEILNSDAQIYGGSNQGNLGGVESISGQCQGQAQYISITVPPLSTIIFSLAWQDN